MWAMTYLSNQQLIETKTKNAEGVRKYPAQGCARQARYPGVTGKSFIATLNWLQTRLGTRFNIRELFQSSASEIDHR